MIRFFRLIKAMGFMQLLRRGIIFAYRLSGFQGFFAQYHDYDDDPPYGYSDSEPQWDNLSFLTKHIKSQVYEFLTTSLSTSHQERLLNEAYKVVRNNYCLFSFHFIQIDALDFNCNPLESVRWPVGKHSSRYFQFDQKYGDIKRVWELNRLQFLDPLLCGYLLGTEKDKQLIRDKFISVFDHWLLQNPHERSVAWACSQEISIRCIKLLFLFYYLDIHIDRVRTKKLWMLLVLSAEHVSRELAYAKTQRNNHVITESVFLIIVGHLFPNVKHAQDCLLQGWEALELCLDDQFFEDGTYIQNSITYHRFALQALLLIYSLTDKEKLLGRIREVFESSLTFLYEVAFGNNGDFPNYGPNDGAILYNWGNIDYRDLRSIQNCLSIATCKAVVHRAPELLIDALITIPNSKVHFSEGCKPEEKREYSIGGLYIIKNRQLSVFCKCASYKGRFPSQNDQLHVDLWVNGIPFLSDSGTYEYFGQKGVDYYHYFLSTAAHNTIRVGGIDQMEKGPRFTWLSKAEARVISFSDVVMSGESLAYVGRIKSDTIHRRTVLLDNGRFIVDDDVLGCAGSNIELFWHLDHSQSCYINDKHQILTESGYTIFFDCMEYMKMEIVRTPQSLYYGAKIPRDTIVISASPSINKFSIRTVVEFDH